MLREFFADPRPSGNEMRLSEKRNFKWGVLKSLLRNLIQSLLPDAARHLDDEEVLHIQSMLFLLKVKAEYNCHQLDLLERHWFPSCGKRNYTNFEGIKRIKHRLLRQFVYDEIEIEEEYLLKVQ